MVWSDEKGRYIIDGESESDDEPVAPPPKITRKSSEEIKKQKEEEEEKKKKEEPKTGLASLQSVAFGNPNAMRRGGRNQAGKRPGSVPAKPMTPFVPTTNAPANAPEEEKKSEKPVEEVKVPQT